MKEENLMQILGRRLMKLAVKNKNIVVIAADSELAMGLRTFSEVFPERFFNVGCANGNVIGLAAGLVAVGKLPFVCMPSMRMIGGAWNQIRNLLCCSNLNVKLIGGFAGIGVGQGGAMKQMLEDIALMRSLANMKVVVPADSMDLDAALLAMVNDYGPTYMRIPQEFNYQELMKDGFNLVGEEQEMEDSQAVAAMNDANILTNQDEVSVLDFKVSRLSAIPRRPVREFSFGGSKTLKAGADLVVFACGYWVALAMVLAEKLEKEKSICVTVVNMYSLKPIDEGKIIHLALGHSRMVSLEDHSVIGGLGSAIIDVLNSRGVNKKIVRIGMKDCFGESGRVGPLFRKYQLDLDSVFQKLVELVG